MFSSMFQSRKSQPTSRPDPTRVFRERLTTTMAAKQYDEAIALLVRLESMEPKSPRWPHKRGDLLRQLHRTDEAFLAYAAAVRLYADEGHNERARAMAKTAVTGVPNLRTLLAQLDGITQSMFQSIAY